MLSGKDTVVASAEVKDSLGYIASSGPGLLETLSHKQTNTSEFLIMSWSPSYLALFFVVLVCFFSLRWA